MSKRFLSIAGALALSLATAGLALGQETTVTTTTTTPTTVTQTTQNADGSWTVVEYPVGKEVLVNLTPSTTIPGARGTARVMRMANGTMINLDLAGVTGDVNNLNLYAVDPNGRLTLIGPVAVNNGTGTFSATTTAPLDKFMLVLSPDADLATYAPNTNVILRSAVPEGLSVIPMARSGEGPGAPVGEKVAAAATPSYSVPMIGIPSLPKKKETEMKVNFANTVHVKRTDFFITPNFNNKGATRVKAKFHNLSDVPTNAFLTLWAVNPEGKYFRIGSTPNKGTPNVATIDSDRNNTNVPFADFGLFLTVEPTATAVTPTGVIVGNIIR